LAVVCQIQIRSGLPSDVRVEETAMGGGLLLAGRSVGSVKILSGKCSSLGPMLRWELVCFRDDVMEGRGERCC
jgi:hypothetical protein